MFGVSKCLGTYFMVSFRSDLHVAKTFFSQMTVRASKVNVELSNCHIKLGIKVNPKI